VYDPTKEPKKAKKGGKKKKKKKKKKKGKGKPKKKKIPWIQPDWSKAPTKPY